jgi:hypothetical protein
MPLASMIRPSNIRIAITRYRLRKFITPHTRNRIDWEETCLPILGRRIARSVDSYTAPTVALSQALPVGFDLRGTSRCRKALGQRLRFQALLLVVDAANGISVSNADAGSWIVVLIALDGHF